MKVLENPLEGFRENPCEVYSQLYMYGYTFQPITGKIIPNTEFDTPDKQALTDPKYALKILEKAFRADSYARASEAIGKIIAGAIKPTADYEPPKTWATELKEIDPDVLARRVQADLAREASLQHRVQTARETSIPVAGVSPEYNTAVAAEAPATTPPSHSKSYTFVGNTFVEGPSQKPANKPAEPAAPSQNNKEPLDNTPWMGGTVEGVTIETAEGVTVEKDSKTGSLTFKGGTFKGLTFS